MLTDHQATLVSWVPTWAGDQERLVRVLAAVDQAFEPLRTAAWEVADMYRSWIADLEGKIARDEPMPYGSDSPASWLEVHLKQQAIMQEQFDQRYRWECSWLDGPMQRTATGEASAILDMLDPVSVVSLSLAAPSNPTAAADGSVRLDFDPRTGVGITVRGGNPQWVQGTHEALLNEIQKCVQPWTWVRKRWSLAVLVVLDAAAGWWMVLRFGIGMRESVVVGGTVGAALFGATWVLIVRRWRAFELLQFGARPRSDGAIRIAASIAFEIGLLYVAPFLS